MNTLDSRILIVEDEVIVAMEIELLLRANGFNVVGKAHNSEKAIELSKSKLPNLILMDINIKGELDGILTCKEILEFMPVHIIFVSAYNDSETYDRINLIQPHYFLPKPFSERDLIKIISEI